MTGQFPYQLEEVSLPTIGLIVLQSDETLEQDFRRLVPVEEASMHTSRIPSGDAVTPETLGAMEADLTQAASLFPNSARFDVIGYACTSGTAHIGADNVARLVK